MEPQLSTAQEIVSALAELGYKAKIDGRLVTVDINPEPGVVRSYTVEIVNEHWSVHQKIVTFVDGEDEEEEAELGAFKRAMEVACAIDKEEDN